MTTIENTSPDTSHSIGRLIKTRWLNPRRKRFWAMVVVLLYTLLGFFAAPLVLRNSVIELLQEDLGRPTQIGCIQVNPFMLSLRVQGFEVSDTDGVRLAAFDEFFVNFQLASLLKWAWTFSQVELIVPYFHFERFDTGDSCLDRLLADFENSRPRAPRSGARRRGPR